MKTLLDREDLVFNPPQLGCVLSLSELPGGGSKIYDRSPYGNHGTITGATWERQPSGLWCLGFDGQDDWVNCGNHASLFPQNLTVEAWLKSTTANWNTNGWAVCLRGASGYILHPNINTKALRTYVYSDTEGVNGGFITPSDITIWHHYAFTYNGSQILSYLDGILVNTQAYVCSRGTTKSGTLYIGRDGTSYGNGFMGEVGIYNRALSPLEVQNHFTREKYLFGVW